MCDAWVEGDRCYIQLATDDYRVTVPVRFAQLEWFVALLTDCLEDVRAAQVRHELSCGTGVE
jgi:hypothetical protein